MDREMSLRLSRKVTSDIGDYNYLMGLMTDQYTGTMENAPADCMYRRLTMMAGFKTSHYDPDTPNMK